MDVRETVKLKLLTMEDLDEVTEIDYSLLGTRRRQYWERRLVMSETSSVPSLAVEVDGQLIGFIVGGAYGWEYGIPQNVGWIDTVGIKKEYQRKGIAKFLFKEMVKNFKEVGVNTIYVFVNWKDWDLLRFFDKMGFTRGDMTNLELKI